MEDGAFKMLSMMLSTQCVQRTVELYIFRSSLLPSPVVSIESDIKESTVLLWECAPTCMCVCMCSRAYVRVRVCRSQNNLSCQSLLFPSFEIWFLLLFPAVHTTLAGVWAPSNSPASISSLQVEVCWDYKISALQHSFYMGSGKPKRLSVL